MQSLVTRLLDLEYWNITLFNTILTCFLIWLMWLKQRPAPLCLKSSLSKMDSKLDIFRRELVDVQGIPLFWSIVEEWSQVESFEIDQMTFWSPPIPNLVRSFHLFVLADWLLIHLCKPNDRQITWQGDIWSSCGTVLSYTKSLLILKGLQLSGGYIRVEINAIGISF